MGTFQCGNIYACHSYEKHIDAPMGRVLTLVAARVAVQHAFRGGGEVCAGDDDGARSESVKPIDDGQRVGLTLDPHVRQPPATITTATSTQCNGNDGNVNTMQR